MAVYREGAETAFKKLRGIIYIVYYRCGRMRDEQHKHRTSPLAAQARRGKCDGYAMEKRGGWYRRKV